ncbi:autophagy-related protein 18g-like isoform X2 [Musa acuminata AAA Group]|uniref:autophagy-related protein 18g-like isoform X2 n=1 Tax=Musa acuminata AAA Group TaxID=214697 RepID=UPI0031D4C8AB
MRRGKGKNGLLPSSLRIISSCLKTVSSNAGSVASTVRSAGASVAASIAVPAEDEKDQVLWAGFDKLELSPSFFKHVLLLGYSNGFQVLDVDDASNVCELVSKRDGPATFLQMQPTPINSEATEGFRASHPLLLVVASDETNGSGAVQGGRLSALIRESSSEPQAGNCISSTVVRFYSLKVHSYVHVLRFRSAVHIVHCSPRIVAVALAAQVVIKDFISKEVISQFRAHTSPISALCFDPSGTLLVTASVHGHNINIFRIMPTRIQNGSSPASYDWTSSHVHLYKLYRGLTAAVIQDISFSHYSQWISIVSSRGTCHIYVISPFGGDASLQPQNVPGERSILIPNLTVPWWSTSCCMIHQQLHPPPPPPSVTYSVVSRIKNVNAGWLSTVTNVAASAAGKISVPSGAIAAAFHNSLNQNTLPAPSKAKSLEHLLVYSPSGHVIQHELLPSSFVESCDNSLKAVPAPLLQLQDEELCVNAEPVQWWDVCRRSNWSEREEDVSRIIPNNQKNSETVLDSGDCEDNGTSYSMTTANSLSGMESVKSERSHWYLSNAEVHISAGKIPIWQKSAICFCVLNPSKSIEGFGNDLTGGEIEFEKLPFDEVEIKRKDLLPVFEQFHCSKSGWNDRVVGGYQTSSSGFFQAKNEFASGTINGLRTTQGLFDKGGPYGPVSLQSMTKTISDESVHGLSSIVSYNIARTSELDASATMPIKCSVNGCSPLHSENNGSYPASDDSVSNGVSTSSLSCNGKLVVDNHSLNGNESSRVPKACTTDVHMEQDGISDSHNSMEFETCFNEGYCKVSELDDCRELTEAVTDADSNSSHCEREKPDEDGDNDDLMGCVFAFSEG